MAEQTKRRRLEGCGQQSAPAGSRDEEMGSGLGSYHSYTVICWFYATCSSRRGIKFPSTLTKSEQIFVLLLLGARFYLLSHCSGTRLADFARAFTLVEVAWRAALPTSITWLASLPTYHRGDAKQLSPLAVIALASGLAAIARPGCFCSASLSHATLQVRCWRLLEESPHEPSSRLLVFGGTGSPPLRWALSRAEADR